MLPKAPIGLVTRIFGVLLVAAGLATAPIVYDSLSNLHVRAEFVAQVGGAFGDPFVLRDRWAWWALAAMFGLLTLWTVAMGYRRDPIWVWEALTREIISFAVLTALSCWKAWRSGRPRSARGA